MRASRLLRTLLLLQNRGRLTSAALARELEVAQRTVLRDVDALCQAGLPVVVHRGQRGGIELGFNYRTRLTGLATDEAEALGVLLSAAPRELATLGMGAAADRACRKLLESLPDAVRERAHTAARRFRVASPSLDADPRLPSLALAVRESRIVRARAHRPDERILHPIALVYDAEWAIEDDLAAGELVPLAACGDINISAHTFTAGTRRPRARVAARARPA